MDDKTATKRRKLTPEDRSDAERIWSYHRLGHRLRPCDAAIALGSNDLGVADYAAELHARELFPVLVFTGANSPATAAVFPRGEAVHFREHAVQRGVPDEQILVEPNATNTGDNVTLSRSLLKASGIVADTIMLISMPYMERRAYATCTKVWPEVDVVCASEDVSFGVYVEAMGNPPLVVDMIVGDLQRIMRYPAKGFAIEQVVPEDVRAAFDRLVAAGYISCLIDE